ncbi:MAG: HEAT repeat domain-containing protein, partial [Tepidisphaeraceae bacterium]
MLKRIVNIALVIVLMLAAGQSFAQAFGQADKLIDVLKSDAPREAKADALRQLAIVGTKDAVPVIAPLLLDEQLSHMARYALEPIADPSVDAALRDALGKAKGRPLVGVIGSLGIRKDVKAIDALTKFLSDADPDVAQAAARALGRIGTAEAAKAIEGAVAGTPAGNQLAFCEGLFRIADTFAAAGQNDAAIAIFDNVRKLNSPLHQVRSAALRGAILARQKDGIALLKESLVGKDPILFAAAAGTSREMPGAEVTQVLCDSLRGSSVDNQMVIFQALGRRKDAAALPTVLAAAKTGEKALRLVAIACAAEIGDPSAAPALLELMGDADKDVATLAKENFASLPGQAVDDAVLAMFNGQDSDKRDLALDLIARRRMLASLPAVIKTAADPDPALRGNAIRKLGELAGPADLPALLDILGKAEGGDIDTAAQTISTVCQKTEKPEECVAKIAPLLAPATRDRKIAIVRILGGIGGNEALGVLRGVLKDAATPAEVRSAAIRALGNWKSADAAPDLLALAKSGADNEKMFGLRSYLGMAGRAELPGDQRLEMCRNAATLVQRPEEKKILLGALGNINSPDALPLIAPHIDDPATSNEAVAAAVSSAERVLQAKLAPADAAKLVDALTKASAA